MEYITIEKSIFDAMMSALYECRSALLKAHERLISHDKQEWIDNYTAGMILQRTQRSMAGLRAEGRIGYSIIEGKVFYPASEVARLLNFYSK